MKLKPEHTQRWITVYDPDTGKRDVILLEVLDPDNIQVLMPNQHRDDGGNCSTCIFAMDDVLELGPAAIMKIPRF